MNKASPWALAAGLLAALGLYRVARFPAGDAAPAVPPSAGDEAASEGAPQAERPAGPRADRRPPAPFGPGEELVYDVGWTLVNAGTLTLALQEDAAAHGYRLSATAKVADTLAAVYPFDYQAETEVDAQTLLPRKATVQQREGSRRRTRITLFDPGSRRAHFEQVGGRQGDVEIPADARDALGALYALRAVPRLAPGARVRLPVCDGGRLYTADVSVGAGEKVETPAGRFDAWRLAPVIRDAGGQAEQAGVTLWLSSDRRRLPVRIELELAVGRFTLALREARTG